MENKQEIKLKLKDNDVIAGVYANQIAVMHSKYEFILDFISMFPPEPTLNARIITTPVALKRMVNAILINLKNYEEKFGKIEEDNSDIETSKIN